MKIQKAVITAAARGGRLFPMADTVQKAMLPVINSDGIQKNIIQIIAEEAIHSGIEEICIVCAPGDEEKYLNNFKSLQQNLKSSFKGQEWAEREIKSIDDLLNRIHFTVQFNPLGYGNAVLSAKEFVKEDPFLLLLGDYIYVSDKEESCISQVITHAQKHDCSVSSVNVVSEHLIGNYGTLTGKHIPNITGVYDIEKIIEKPSISIAELELQTPGIRTGFYLCFFGIHAFSNKLMEMLNEEHQRMDYTKDLLLLTPTLQKLAQLEKYQALEVNGRRYDTSKKYGLLEAQLAVALAGKEKEKVLSNLVTLLADASKS